MDLGRDFPVLVPSTRHQKCEIGLQAKSSTSQGISPTAIMLQSITWQEFWRPTRAQHQLILSQLLRPICRASHHNYRRELVASRKSSINITYQKCFLQISILVKSVYICLTPFIASIMQQASKYIKRVRRILGSLSDHITLYRAAILAQQSLKHYPRKTRRISSRTKLCNGTITVGIDIIIIETMNMARFRTIGIESPTFLIQFLFC